jgi:hypothetical protein
MSAVMTWPKSKTPSWLGSFTSIPSISTLVWFELLPRRNTEVLPPGPPVWTTFKPGTVLRTSGKVRF